jgi:hypothetical protein
MVKSFSPVYGKALNLIRSGVAVPEACPFVPFAEGTLSEARDTAELLFAIPTVVIRWACVVSSLGGRGRDERSGNAGSLVAFHK